MGAFLLVSLGLLTVAFLASFLTLYGQYSSMNSMERGNCTISNVTYPTSLPDHSDDFEGFIECDCGRRCVSDLGTCITVYGSLFGNSESRLFKEYYDLDSSACTIGEISCYDGESATSRLESINTAIETAQRFINISNTIIDCFYDDQYLYLSNDNSDVEIKFYVSMGFFSFFTLLFITCGIILYRINTTNNTQSTTDEP